MGSRQDAKLEKAIKGLLQLPYNRRCVDCNSMGPQYVLPSFNIFVCTTCSGVHREFGHRAKGVSVSMFKPEEVEALKQGGNAVFAAQYLSRWQESAFPKPLDRSPGRIKEWIQAVYMDLRFRGSPRKADQQQQQSVSLAAQARVPSFRPSHGSAAAAAGTTTASGSQDGGSGNDTSHVLQRKLSDVLGLGMPKLTVHSEASTPGSAHRAASSSSGEAHSVGPRPPGTDLLDVPSSSASAPAAAVHDESAGWAAFGDDTVGQAAKGPSLPTPSAAHGWESFGDDHAPPSSNGTDVFYPEFDSIRETGLLPNGQPVPPPGYPVPAGYGSSRASPVAAAAYNPALAALAGQYGGALPRSAPTVLIPSPPRPPVSVSSSPASAAYPASSSGRGSVAGGGLFPPSTSSSQGAGGGWGSLSNGAGTAPAQAPWYAAPPSAAAQQTSPDAFAGLARGLTVGLPSLVPTSASPGQAYAAATSSPGQAYAYASPSPGAPYSPQPQQQPPVQRKASSNGNGAAHTLFGRSGSMYDLSAPSAPQPAATGNPFA